jgi:ketosteroid isomerase-like protein
MMGTDVMRGIAAALLCAVLAVGSVGCRSRSAGTGETPAEARAALERTHRAYIDGINSNTADVWLESLASDVVYFVPNRPPVVGKQAVGSWIEAYLDESHTHWSKTLNDLVVNGDWAFGRYDYSVSDNVVIHDPEVEGGGTANDTGWGFIVYHRDGDGKWRVARDGWGSAKPAR